MEEAYTEKPSANEEEIDAKQKSPPNILIHQASECEPELTENITPKENGVSENEVKNETTEEDTKQNNDEEGVKDSPKDDIITKKQTQDHNENTEEIEDNSDSIVEVADNKQKINSSPETGEASTGPCKDVRGDAVTEISSVNAENVESNGHVTSDSTAETNSVRDIEIFDSETVPSSVVTERSENLEIKGTISIDENAGELSTEIKNNEHPQTVNKEEDANKNNQPKKTETTTENESSNTVQDNTETIVEKQTQKKIEDEIKEDGKKTDDIVNTPETITEDHTTNQSTENRGKLIETPNKEEKNNVVTKSLEAEPIKDDNEKSKDEENVAEEGVVGSTESNDANETKSVTDITFTENIKDAYKIKSNDTDKAEKSEAINKDVLEDGIEENTNVVENSISETEKQEHIDAPNKEESTSSEESESKQQIKVVQELVDNVYSNNDVDVTSILQQEPNTESANESSENVNTPEIPEQISLTSERSISPTKHSPKVVRFDNNVTERNLELQINNEQTRNDVVEGAERESLQEIVEEALNQNQEEANEAPAIIDSTARVKSEVSYSPEPLHSREIDSDELKTSKSDIDDNKRHLHELEIENQLLKAQINDFKDDINRLEEGRSANEEETRDLRLKMKRMISDGERNVKTINIQKEKINRLEEQLKTQERKHADINGNTVQTQPVVQQPQKSGICIIL